MKFVRIWLQNHILAQVDETNVVFLWYLIITRLTNHKPADYQLGFFVRPTNVFFPIDSILYYFKEVKLERNVKFTLISRSNDAQTKRQVITKLACN